MAPRSQVCVIDAVTLERIGIIVNFVAAFLIAPELIGRQRLQGLQRSLEERAGRVERHLRDVAASRGLLATFIEVFEALGLLLVLVLTIPLVLVVAILNALAPQLVVVAFTAWATLILLFGTWVEIRIALDVRPRSRRRLALRLALSPVFGAATVIRIFANSVWYSRKVIYRYAAGFFGAVARNLAGDGQLAGLLVGVGIALLICGFLCQFLATFLRST